MLKKITSIKNIGKFRNAGASGDSTFEKYTMIFAPNGYGKTTLCTILRSVSEDRPELIMGRKTLGSDGDPKVEILMPGGGAAFNNGAWNTGLPNVTVFDGTFIAENVHSGDAVGIEHKRNLYRVIVGRDGVALAQQEEQLAAQSREQTKVINTREGAVKEQIPDGMDINNFIGLENNPDADDEIEAANRKIAAVQQADQIRSKSLLEQFPAPSMPDQFSDILSQSLDSIQKDVEERVNAHFHTHKMAEDGQSWVAKGMDYNDGQTCPFCGQGIKDMPLIEAYKTLFGEEYGVLKDRVQTLIGDIEHAFGDRALGEINTLAVQNEAELQFWKNHCDLNQEALTLPASYVETIKKLHDEALGLAENKSGALLESLIVDENFQHTLDAFKVARSQVISLNESITKANECIETIKARVADTDLATAQAALLRLRTAKNRHTEPINGLCEAYTAALGDKKRIDAEKTNVRNALNNHMTEVIRPYETKINDYLDKFNAGFSIAETSHMYPGGIAASSYRIVINDINVDLGNDSTAEEIPSFKNTLSAGDRSTLALAFFLAHLDQDPDLANRIVAFDDPFNSQDRFRRSQTVNEIIRKGGECAQVVLLSHDPGFLKYAWEKCPGDQRKALQIVDQPTQGAKLMPFDINEACKGRAASELDDLISFDQTREGNGRDIIKKMRVVLETHCRSAYPGCFEADGNLGKIITLIRQKGETCPAYPLLNELEEINDYSRAHHHGENPGNDDAGDQIDVTELHGYVKRTLRIAKAMPS